MISRLIITGKNHELSRRAFTLAALRSGHTIPFTYSGMPPESAAGGTRASDALHTAAPSYPKPLSLGAVRV